MWFGVSVALIFLCCLLGFIWSGYNWYKVYSIKVVVNTSLDGKLLEEQTEQVEQMIHIGDLIKAGADAFLQQEYFFCFLWLLVMGGVVLLTVDLYPVFSEESDSEFRMYTTISFLVGGFTSIAGGYICMKIATESNFRTAFQAQTGLNAAFQTAFQAGCAMGFCLVSLALFVLTLIIVIFYSLEPTTEIMEWVAGYGLGASTVALFGRVGGGIYTKAADVGADLVGKFEAGLNEDSPKNPATIADNVGDNVGDVAGMGADLFGSFAESTCAALVVSSQTLFIDEKEQATIDFLMYPLLVTAIGIVICILTTIVAIFLTKVDKIEKIEATLKYQLIISTVLLTPAIAMVAYISLPFSFYLKYNASDMIIRYPHHGILAVLIGLYAGLAIGYITEAMTSHSYTPVREVANQCKTSAATNIIYGLALGYLSTIIPIICISIASFVSYKMLGFYGVALAALGMLSNLPIGLAIDGYGPISDNAGGIAEMSELGERIREKTDALDAAGNTTAAIGKGFAIGSAALVSLSLYGGFLTNVLTYDTENRFGSVLITNPLIFSGLLIGAMLPYAFSAMTMKSVGKAAEEMVAEIRGQIKSNPGILDGSSPPDYKRCIEISTKASLKEMVAPGALVILTPVLIGIFFGPMAIAGLLPGALISGVQMAISAANTGGAWDNAKKYIESGQLLDDKGVPYKKGSDAHKAAVIGDTVGDPLKDTSGPSLNILVKLMAILSLVFATFFCQTAIFYPAMEGGIQ